MLGFFRRALVAIAGGLALCAPAAAQTKNQDYPARAVRIIIPLAAGGGGDLFARALAEELQKRWGRTFIVENRTGGGLNIGTRACAEAAPDGYTICVLSSEPIVYSQFLYKSLPFDPEKGFEPISILLFNTLAFAVNPSMPVKTITDVIALAKAKPGTLSYSTFSFPLAYFMDKLNKENDIDIVRVPYRGGNEVVTAVMSGSTPITLLGLANMIPQLQNGNIKALALNARARSPLFPDVPTMQEVGFEKYPQSWFGLWAPAGTPKAIVAKLNAAVSAITSEPTFLQKNFIDRGIEQAVMSPEEFARFIVQDRATAAQIVKASGAEPQ